MVFRHYFDRELLTLSLFALNFLLTSSSSLHMMHQFRFQRSEPDEMAIVNKFDVNEDTIILTKESRSLGATYINETEVMKNEECLIWCWEHQNCNVAVYEEMTRRSCFLFDCGSPADFRCKFMNHKAYTSSLLKVTQHSYELNQWGREIKQEKQVATDNSPLTTTSTMTATTTPIPVSTPNLAVLKSPVSTPTAVTEPETRLRTATVCRHYQFQCLNSTECIAIYNVCDGIPQCPDGSDESIELHCPTAGNLSPTTVRTVQVSEGSISQNVQVSEQKPGQQPPPPPQPPNVPKVRPPISISNENNKQPAQPPPVMDKERPMPGKDFSDAVAWPEVYHGRPENVDYEHAMEGAGPVAHSPFAHKHSTFLAANNPHFLNKWPSEYERYPQQSSNLDQQYNIYEQRLEEPTYSKSQLPDYDRTMYDTYHPDENALWVERERLRNANYLNSDFTQPNAPSSNRQAAYPIREDLYSSQQYPSKLENSGPYVPIEKNMIKHVHHIHEGSHPKLVSEQESLPPPPAVHRPSKSRPQLYSPYEDMPRTDYRPYLRPHSIINPEQQLQQQQQQQQVEAVAAAAQMYDQDEVLKESLSKQLKNLPGKPLHLYEPIAEVPVHTMAESASENPKESITEPSKASSKAVTTAHPNHTKAPSKGGKKNRHHENLINVSSAELYQAQSIRIHESNNAIVALTLGLIVTALLLVLVGCRLKTIKRRSARRGRRLAHDADYLVNGLYL